MTTKFRIFIINECSIFMSQLYKIMYLTSDKVECCPISLIFKTQDSKGNSLKLIKINIGSYTKYKFKVISSNC